MGNKAKKIRTILIEALKKTWISFLLIILLLASIFCIIKFSKIGVWELEWEELEKIFLCPPKKTDAYEAWSILNNLSLAYISSLLFYVIVEFIPTKMKEKKALTIISNKVMKIYGEMSYIIRVVLFEIGVEKDIDNIEISDLSDITTLFFDSTTKYADITHMRNGENTNSKEFSYNVLDKCKDCGMRIEQTIDEIFNMQIAGNISDELVNLLSEIRQSRFLHLISFFDHDNTRNIPGVESIVLDFDKSFLELIQQWNKLKKYKFELLDYHFEKMTEEDINKERESMIYMLGRAFFMRASIEKIQNSLSYMPNIQLDETKFHKLNGVLMEVLVAYDVDNKKYGYLLPIAKSIAEYLCKYDGSEQCRDIACLNYLQVLRRMGTYSKKSFSPAKDIIADQNKEAIYRLGALIIVRNFQEAQKLFFDLEDSLQEQVRSFPIYRLWDNPPLPAIVEQSSFTILKKE